MTRRPPRPDDATRITRVTTRIGDGGMTRLVGNREVRKDDPRLEAYGTTDELQVVMGMARDALAAAAAGPGAPALLPLLERHLVYLQQRIFTLNGELATRMEDRWENMPAIGAEDVAYMEAVIDALNRPLAPLKDFTLPGGASGGDGAAPGAGGGAARGTGGRAAGGGGADPGAGAAVPEPAERPVFRDGAAVADGTARGGAGAGGDNMDARAGAAAAAGVMCAALSFNLEAVNFCAIRAA